MATPFITHTPFNTSKTLNLTQNPKYKRKGTRSFKPNSKNTSSTDFSSIRSKFHLENPVIHTLNFVLSHTETQSYEHLAAKERPPTNDKGEKCKQERARRRGRKLETSRKSLLWYMKSSISYILRKARAFYNEFCCDTYVDAKLAMVMQMEGTQTMLVDPYFSIPVLPPNF